MPVATKKEIIYQQQRLNNELTI